MANRKKVKSFYEDIVEDNTGAPGCIFGSAPSGDIEDYEGKVCYRGCRGCKSWVEQKMYEYDSKSYKQKGIFEKEVLGITKRKGAKLM